MPIKLLSNACNAECIGITHTAVVAIASSALQDLDVITEVEKTIVLDRMKFRRTRSTYRRDLIKGSRYNQITKIRGLSFNGIKYKTIDQEKKGSKLYKKVIS